MYCHGYQVLFQMPGIQQLAALQLQIHGVYAAAPVLDAPACCAGAVCVNRAIPHCRHSDLTHSEQQE